MTCMTEIGYIYCDKKAKTGEIQEDYVRALQSALMILSQSVSMLVTGGEIYFRYLSTQCYLYLTDFARHWTQKSKLTSFCIRSM